MPTRAEIVAEARTWIGTPWHHQAHKKGVGADCLGFIKGTMVNQGVLRPMEEWERLGVPEKYIRYAHKADGVTMMEAFTAYWTPVPLSQIQIADVLLLKIDGVPQHAGIVADYRHGGLSIIHSLNDKSRGTGSVVEHRLIPQVLVKAVAAFSPPGVT